MGGDKDLNPWGFQDTFEKRLEYIGSKMRKKYMQENDNIRMD